MARKRYSDEDILKLLREIELHLASGSDVPAACRAAGVSDATYYNWSKKFGGMGKSQLSELKALKCMPPAAESYRRYRAQWKVAFPQARLRPC